MNKPEILDVVNANEAEFLIRCPECGQIGFIDIEQFRGEVSIVCPSCDYHETHDLRED